MIPTLFYCAARSGRFAEIALRHGYRYGAQLPAFLYHKPEFVDQNWKNPDRVGYIRALREHQPALASVLDWEQEDQFCEVMEWATEAAQHVTEAVIVIPKVAGGICRIPRQICGKEVRLGYSVPTGFGGTTVPVEEFAGWPVHLLGGQPREQMKLAQRMDVRSADGNYHQLKATKWCEFYNEGNSSRWMPLARVGLKGVADAPYVAFELSCINIRAAWHGNRSTLRWATESDLLPIKKIANQYSKELGYVTWPGLRQSAAKRELLLAEKDKQVVGFCRFHTRRDGWQTVYEIAVDRDHHGDGIGKAMLGAIPRPMQLKCTADNARANQFYADQGMTLIGVEKGRKRPLNLWKSYRLQAEG